MSLENDAGSEARRESQIQQYFQKTDRRFRYDPDRNLKRLAMAGAYVANPDYTGSLSSWLLTVRRRSFAGFSSLN